MKTIIIESEGLKHNISKKLIDFFMSCSANNGFEIERHCKLEEKEVYACNDCGLCFEDRSSRCIIQDDATDLLQCAAKSQLAIVIASIKGSEMPEKIAKVFTRFQAYAQTFIDHKALFILVGDYKVDRSVYQSVYKTYKNLGRMSEIDILDYIVVQENDGNILDEDETLEQINKIIVSIK